MGITLSKKEISLDIQYQGFIQTIYSQQGDKDSRELKIYLYDDGAQYIVGSGIQTKLVGTRADGAVVMRYIGSENGESITQNTITLRFRNEELACKGVAKYKIEFYDKNFENTLSSFPFRVVVDENVYDKNGLIATPVIDEIKALENQIENAEKQRQSAEKQRQKDTAEAIANAKTATSDANVATKNANDATANANTATSEAQKATKNANDVTLEAKTATNNAITATSKANDAITNAQTATENAQAATSEAKAATQETKTATKNANDATASLDSKLNTHNTSNTSHSDIRDLIQGLTSRLNALADSDDTTLDQLSEIVAYIKSNKSLIDNITTSKVNVADIIDNLTSSATNKPLSAKQGKALKQILDEHTHDDRYYTENEVDNKLAGRLPHFNITTATDFNTLTKSGIYHIKASGCGHSPCNNHGTLYVDYDVGTPYQIFEPDSNTNSSYKRGSTSSGWTEWITRKYTDTWRDIAHDYLDPMIPDVPQTKDISLSIYGAHEMYKYIMNHFGESVNNLKKSVSDGKASIASAITNNGVTTNADATFDTMAGNINTVARNQYDMGSEEGITATKRGNAVAGDVLAGKTFTSEKAGVNKAGTIPTLSADTNSVDGVNTHHITDYLEISAFVKGDSKNYFCCRIPKNTYTGSTGYISTLASNFGDAAVGHVLSGKKFTSEAGLKLAGAMNNHAGATVQWCGYEHVSVIPHPQDSANQLLIEIPNPNNYSGYYDKNSKIRVNMYCPISKVAYGTRIGRYTNNGANDSNSVMGTFSRESTNPITASAVLSGKIGFVNGSKVTGNMPNYGAVSKSLSAGGSYTIPAGYHNGSGKVTANSLASQTSANATASCLLQNNTAWVNGTKISGSLGTYVGVGLSVVGSSGCGSNKAYLFKRNAMSSMRVLDNVTSINISSGTYADYGIFNMANGVSLAFSCGSSPFGYDRSIYVIFRLWYNTGSTYAVDASSLQGIVVQAQSTKTINLKGSSGTISLEVTHSGSGSGVIAIKNVGSNWTMHDFFVYVL